MSRGKVDNDKNASVRFSGLSDAGCLLSVILGIVGRTYDREPRAIITPDIRYTTMGRARTCMTREQSVWLIFSLSGIHGLVPSVLECCHLPVASTEMFITTTILDNPIKGEGNGWATTLNFVS